MKEYKPTIIVDMDEVLGNLFGPWMKILEDRHNIDIDVRSLKSWETHLWIPELEAHHVYEVLNEPNLYRNLPVKRGAKTAMKYLNDNYNVIIATAAPINSLYAIIEKRLWLEEHFPFIDTKKQYAPIQNKTLVAKPGDILIDDGLHNIYAHEEIGGVGIVMDYPHNQDETIKYRAYGWKDVLHCVELITDEYIKAKQQKIKQEYAKLSKEGKTQRYK